MSTQEQNQSQAPMKESLLQKAKSVLSSFAQMIGLQENKEMSKTELVQTLGQHKDEVKPMLNQTESKTETLESASAEKSKKEFIDSRNQGSKTVPESISLSEKQQNTSSYMEDTQTKPAGEPADTWHGETGPEMPRQYGRTMLYAMPRDPNWVFLYWEISDDSKREIQDQKGDWIFETTTSMLRVYDENGTVYQEVPVLLDAMSWYLSLPSSRDFQFEIGLKSGDEFILLAKSNKISLSQAAPSSVTDEEWAVVEERFAEMLQSAAAGRAGSIGASEKVMPHLVAERFRIPWDIPSLHQLPSSHEFVSSQSLSSHSISSKDIQKPSN